MKVSGIFLKGAELGAFLLLVEQSLNKEMIKSFVFP